MNILNINIKSIKSRKGVISYIQTALIALMALLIFSLFLFKVYTNLTEKMSVQNCRNSIAAHDFVASGTAREIFTDIKCPTREISIKDLNKAKSIIAEDMHRCWYVWGQGNGQYFKNDGNFCHVCSVYQFGDKGKEVKGFVKYLGTENIKIKYPGDTEGISYQDYFQGFKSPNSAEVIGRQAEDITDDDIINTSQKYATIFVYSSWKDDDQAALEGGVRTQVATRGGTYVALGTAAGAAGISGVVGVLAGVSTVNIWNPVGWVAGGVLLVLTGAMLLKDAAMVENPQWISFIAFRPYNAEELKALNCQQLVVNQMSNAGTDYE